MSKWREEMRVKEKSPCRKYQYLGKIQDKEGGNDGCKWRVLREASRKYDAAYRGYSHDFCVSTHDL